ncbi:hypothetical protein MRB53_038920 [Persea americana]|nr:hypothetical protein MRB53_038920 [Persea americana]
MQDASMDVMVSWLRNARAGKRRLRSGNFEIAIWAFLVLLLFACRTLDDQAETMVIVHTDCTGSFQDIHELSRPSLPTSSRRIDGEARLQPSAMLKGEMLILRLRA